MTKIQCFQKRQILVIGIARTVGLERYFPVTQVGSQLDKILTVQCPRAELDSSAKRNKKGFCRIFLCFSQTLNQPMPGHNF